MSDFYYPSKTVTARKDYDCVACEVINEAWNEADILALPVDELIAYQKAKAKFMDITVGFALGFLICACTYSQPKVVDNYVCKPDTFKWPCKGASGKTIVDSPAIGCPVRVDIYWGTKK